MIHPLLLAAYPVLFLFAENTADQLTFDPLWLPLAAAVGGAIVMLGALTLIFRNVHRAGIAASASIVAFFSFGHARNLVGETIGEGVLFAVWVGLVVAGFGVAAWLGSRARKITAPMNFLAAVPVAFTLVPLGDFALTRGAVGAVLEPVTANLQVESESLRDIYYLVFDRYAGSPTLERHFGFDNEPFLRELEQRGFTVARDSVANYVKTNLSLASSLQMEYLDGDDLEAQADSPADHTPINRVFQEALAVPKLLKGLGYEFILVPSWWPPVATNADADMTLRYEGASEFTIALLDTTMVSALTGPRDEVHPFAESELRNYTLHQVDTMLDVPWLPGPKFVMAHFMLPHPPMVFDRDGSPFDGQTTTLSAEEKYVRQLEFTNSQILRMVDAIAASPGGDAAVIVLQADEGPFPDRYTANEATFQWADATPEELEIKFRILNAIRVPGADSSALGFHDSATPVNTFRIVFNALFDAGRPLASDRVYTHVDNQHYYDFIEISDRIPGWSGAR